MLTFLWMNVAHAQTPDWMQMDDVQLPDWIELGGMYDTEPMVVLAYPYVNYVHGLEANIRLGTGLGKDVYRTPQHLLPLHPLPHPASHAPTVSRTSLIHGVNTLAITVTITHHHITVTAHKSNNNREP